MPTPPQVPGPNLMPPRFNHRLPPVPGTTLLPALLLGFALALPACTPADRSAPTDDAPLETQEVTADPVAPPADDVTERDTEIDLEGRRDDSNYREEDAGDDGTGDGTGAGDGTP